ncbi:MAG: hypothetical protein PHX18_08295 [Candidatus Gastranaerophilales bacterium]|nr:hypothetical protein [Candidatus Gastranaerophilales bacterium]
MNKQEQINFLQTLIFKEKDFLHAMDFIEESAFSGENDFLEFKAHIFFGLKEYDKAADLFYRVKKFYHASYALLLNHDPQKAYEIIQLADVSGAALWQKTMCELFTSEIKTIPGYMQIKCFLEKDLSLFIKLGLIDYIQKLLDYNELFFDINPESYKIFAKAFLYNNYPDLAFEFLQRALDFTQKDPEIYYLHGLYCIDRGEIQDAKRYLSTALALSNHYLPARELLEQISKTILSD